MHYHKVRQSVGGNKNMIPGIRAPTMIWWNIGEESTNTATMPIHTTDTRIVTPKDGMVAVWGEGILGGKLLLL